MPFGYMGKILVVDLSDYEVGGDSASCFTEVPIEDAWYEQFLTGYGLAARYIFENQKPNVDPLGPDNHLAFMSGLLTGTGAFFSGRWMVAGKSPLTGTWGDANCGGYFAPALKKTGYDGIFVKGAAKTPVYLLLDGAQQELLDASDLWGTDTAQTDDWFKKTYGDDVQIACIGPAGEWQSPIAGIVTDKGRLAARSGLGAVMGSKKLKALCVRGTQPVKIHDVKTQSRITVAYMRAFDRYKHLRMDRFLGKLMNAPLFAGLLRFLSKHPKLFSPPAEMDRYVMTTWGTPGVTSNSANIGDSPVKNWAGTGEDDFPEASSQFISNDSVTQYRTRRYGCHHCPMACGGIVSVIDDDFDIQEAHQPEYETLCGFGTMLLNDHVRSIIKVNDLCNRAGLDTISTAATVAWAFEAFEKGHLNTLQTEGLDLTWKYSKSVIDIVEKMATQEKGFGEILRRGVKAAAEYYGSVTVPYAMHVGGQELPMHDCRSPLAGLGLGAAYELEPTPGRHTSSMYPCQAYLDDLDEPSRVLPLLGLHIHPMKRKPSDPPEAEALKMSSCFMDLVNGLGMCAMAFDESAPPPIVEWANTSTGWDKDFQDYMWIAQRIKTVRHAFNVREGIAISDIVLPDRARGIPPMERGPNKGSTPDLGTARTEYYKAMGYDQDTGWPLPETLDALDLEFVKNALYPTSVST
ncbi:aldehyde ferredoxin oxidoreductase family protein [Candidatus Bipolaricaulota bacterium]|nr:aldehyde ferredoxin oxidoreductase family protein [Candidatus Bipolaricaulota bacterium]